jgi:hypothetical protein
VTSLWILPVIRAGAAIRVAYLIGSAGAHGALSGWFNFLWLNTPPQGIDGGPLGFLTWAIPALVGTLACDAIAGAAAPPRAGRLLAWSVALMVLGYGLSCGTRLYDVPAGTAGPLPRLAENPVLPPLQRVRVRGAATTPPVPRPWPPPSKARTSRRSTTPQSHHAGWLAGQVRVVWGLATGRWRP